MSFQLMQIGLYNRKGELRSIQFKTGAVNVITGGSKTGKSALIDIVDYCLGRSDYIVAHGVIRDTVVCYALMLQTANGKVLIARPIPPDGQKTGTDVFFSPIAEDKLPALTDLQANSTVKALVTFLTETAGITPNENVPPQGQSRSPLRATIDHTKFYLFQGQNQLSNKNLLFFRQEDSWAPQTIKDTLPYFLGAVGDDQLDRQLKLQRARRELKLLERRLEDEEAIRGRDNSKGLALFTEAREAGIFPGVSQPSDFEMTLGELRRALEWRPSAAIAEPEGSLGELTRRRDVLQEQLRQVKREIDAAQVFARDQDGFSREVHEQHHRLSAIGLFGKQADHADMCPLCSQILATPVPKADQINASLNHLDKQMENVNRQRPRLDEYISQKESQAAELRRQIAETKAEVEGVIAQQEVLSTLRSVEVAQARVIGRISLFIDSVRETADSAELRSKIDQARDHVQELEDGLSGEAGSERLDAALRIIGDHITRWSRELLLEHSENPLQFDLKKLTVVSYRDSGAIPLSEMGSGENWVGYHLTALLALHKWFVDKKRPVPHFLMIDQPAQYYFPADIPKDSAITALNDEDREAVRRMFQFVFNVVESLSGHFQIIITEHADLQDDWYRAAVVERWRGPKKLIPESWYSSDPKGSGTDSGTSAGSDAGPMPIS